MKKEYAVMVNLLLEQYHTSREQLCVLNLDPAHVLYRGITHLFFAVQALGESDDDELREFHNLILLVSDNKIPEPYPINSNPASDQPNLKAMASAYDRNEPFVFAGNLEPTQLVHWLKGTAGVIEKYVRLKDRATIFAQDIERNAADIARYGSAISECVHPKDWDPIPR